MSGQRIKNKNRQQVLEKSISLNGNATLTHSDPIMKEKKYLHLVNRMAGLAKEIFTLRSVFDMSELYLNENWNIVGYSGQFVYLTKKIVEFAAKKKSLKSFLRAGDFDKIAAYLERVRSLKDLSYSGYASWQKKYEGPKSGEKIGDNWIPCGNCENNKWQIVKEKGRRKIIHRAHIDDHVDCYLISAQEYGGPHEDLKISYKIRTPAKECNISSISLVFSAASGEEATFPDLIGYAVCNGLYDNKEASIQRQGADMKTIYEVLEPGIEYQVTVERTGGRILRKLKNLRTGQSAPVLETIDSKAVYDRQNYIGFHTYSGEMELYDIKIFTRKSRFGIDQFQIPFDVEVGIRDKSLAGRIFKLRLGLAQHDDRVFNTLMFEDVTRRREDEEKLIIREKYFRTLIENVYEFIVILDRNGAINYGSPSVETLLGHKIKKLIGRSIFDFVHPEDLAAAREKFSFLIKNKGIVASAEYRVRDSKGKWHAMEVTGRNLLHDPAVSGIVINARDITRRKKAEYALRESEERYRTLVETMNEGLASMDSTGRITFINKAIRDVIGDITGRNMLDFLDKNNSRIYKEQIKKRKKGIADPYELAVAIKDNQKVFVKVSPRSVFDNLGKFQGSVVVVTNITKLKLAEEELRESEERFRSIFENIRDIYYCADMEGKLTLVNPAAVAIFGYHSVEEVIGKDVAELYYHPEERETFLEELEKHGEVKNRGVMAKRKDGTPITIEVSTHLLYDESGRPVAVEGIGRDITERKQAQQALQEERDNLEARVAQSTEKLRKSERKLQERLKELTCLFNIRQEFDRDLSLDEILSACTVHIWEALSDHRNKNVVINLDGHRVSAGSGSFQQDGSLESLIMISGMNRGFLRVCSVISNGSYLLFEQDLVKQAAASLSAYIHNRELRSQLIQSEKLAAAGHLAAAVAHEINNPLGAIKNSLYILKRAISRGHEDYAYIKLMDDEIDRVARIISQLFGLYKPKARQVQPIELAKVAGNVLKMLESKIKRQGIIVRNELLKSGSRLYLPQDQVTQVLYNVILNAVQVMPDKGTISLASRKAGEMVELTINDTGPGIAEDVIPHIFEPFFTTKTFWSNPREGMGMGVGLSVSKSIMDSLGGSISVNTKPGEGTAFVLCFPAKRANQTAGISLPMLKNHDG